MIIPPSTISQTGPGIDVSNQPSGVSIEMSDPVQDLEYALNSVTLVYDLLGAEQVRLVFGAMEYGDEPHAPPASPFGDDANFDGVAVSADGTAWYEIQDLRHLRSDKFTAFDIDLDAAVAGVGLSYVDGFRVRFSQYDNNPAPMDGIFIRGIVMTGIPELVTNGAMEGTYSTAVQTITMTATGGTWTVAYDGGAPSAALAYNAPLATVKSTLEGLAGVGPVSVSGTPGASYVVTFEAERYLKLVTLGVASLTGGTATIAHTQRGGCAPGWTIMPGSSDVLVPSKETSDVYQGLASQRLTRTTGGSFNAAFHQAGLALQAGTTYRLEFAIKVLSGSLSSVRVATPGSQTIVSDLADADWTVHSHEFVAGTNATELQLYAVFYSLVDLLLDSVSLRPI